MAAPIGCPTTIKERTNIMYSDNQILKISGSFDQLGSALEFGLCMSEDLDSFSKGKYSCAFQKTEDGGFVVGWLEQNKISGTFAVYKIHEEWSRCPCDLEILSLMIQKYLEEQTTINENEKTICSDVSFKRGFLMESVNWNTKGVKDWNHGILIFHAYQNMYGK